jgi:hypothetical protein
MKDQQPVQTLAPDGADPPFGVSVRLGRPRWTAKDQGLRVGEDDVEAGSELGVAIADQEAEGLGRVCCIDGVDSWVRRLVR